MHAERLGRVGQLKSEPGPAPPFSQPIHVNVREGIIWPSFREGPVWDPRCQELGTLSIIHLNLTREPRQDDQVRRCMIGSEDRVEEHN
jgi:hypothetical protein